MTSEKEYKKQLEYLLNKCKILIVISITVAFLVISVIAMFFYHVYIYKDINLNYNDYGFVLKCLESRENKTAELILTYNFLNYEDYKLEKIARSAVSSLNCTYLKDYDKR